MLGGMEASVALPSDVPTPRWRVTGPQPLLGTGPPPRPAAPATHPVPACPGPSPQPERPAAFLQHQLRPRGAGRGPGRWGRRTRRPRRRARAHPARGVTPWRRAGGGAREGGALGTGGRGGGPGGKWGGGGGVTGREVGRGGAPGGGVTETAGRRQPGLSFGRRGRCCAGPPRCQLSLSLHPALYCPTVRGAGSIPGWPRPGCGQQQGLENG